MKQPKLSKNSDDGQATQSSEALRMSFQTSQFMRLQPVHLHPHETA